MDSSDAGVLLGAFDITRTGEKASQTGRRNTHTPNPKSLFYLCAFPFPPDVYGIIVNAWLHDHLIGDLFIITVVITQDSRYLWEESLSPSVEKSSPTNVQDIIYAPPSHQNSKGHAFCHAPLHKQNHKTYHRSSPSFQCLHSDPDKPLCLGSLPNTLTTQQELCLSHKTLTAA